MKLGILLSSLLFFTITLAAQEPSQNWTHQVRIGAYGLGRESAEAIVREAQLSNVFGIEVDNDIPGRYESFLDPAEKLKAIHTLAQAAHKAGNKAFVYIAGTECITANADKSPHSVMKDHPEWLQRKITGEPAVFSSGAAFWIAPGDEDVWISPYAQDWRKIYIERVRQIAATGIDGIYVDIPYWMTHFDGWEHTWASFDDATVAAFRAKTGLDAKKDLKLDDYQDANFRKWIDFRIETMTDFVREIRENARSVAPQIMVIPEIYPGIETEATVVGADVYEMYPVVDVIAHEYEFGGGEHMAASRTQLDWFLYQAGMLSFRAFAEGKPTWILNYSWDGDKTVDKRDAMKNLASSIVMAGANFWDAPGHSMAGTNDLATRQQIFDWIARNEKELYSQRAPLQPVGVYFSPKSRDYTRDRFLSSYRGTLLLLLQHHRAFQVVTPRTLAQFHGRLLVLPQVSVLNASEIHTLKSYAAHDGHLVILGDDDAGLSTAPNAVALSSDPAHEYLLALEKDFVAASANPPRNFLDTLDSNSQIELKAPATVAANFANVDGIPHIFLANFSGLLPSKVAVPVPVIDARVSIPVSMGTILTYLPFLGEPQVLGGETKGDRVEFLLPALERGAIVWVGGKK
jgi:endo-alpha-1,4-polygalactosaminidase (GH114 family)